DTTKVLGGAIEKRQRELAGGTAHLEKRYQDRPRCQRVFQGIGLSIDRRPSEVRRVCSSVNCRHDSRLPLKAAPNQAWAERPTTRKTGPSHEGRGKSFQLRPPAFRLGAAFASSAAAGG